MKMDIETVGRKKSAVRNLKGTAVSTTSPVVFKSIVVPIDFSKTSLKALEYAIALANEFGSKIHLIHVLEFPAVFNSTSQPSYALWDKEVKRMAAERLAKLGEEKVDNFTSSSEVRFGRPHEVITETARKRKADLIVIGTHGFTGLKHLMLGSTAERVIRHAPCSVLTVRSQHARDPKSILNLKKILVPTDFSKPAEGALQSAVALAGQYTARLHLLYVVPFRYAVGEYDQVDYPLFEAGEMDAAKKKLATARKAILAKNISTKTEIRRGRPATVITEVEEELAADLVVIATHGVTGWRRALLGSTTEEVVRHSTGLVLVVRKK